MSPTQTIKHLVSAGLSRFHSFKHREWLSDFEQDNPALAESIRKVVGQNLTYLDQIALTDLAAIALSLDMLGVRGVIVEAGCALGGSAIALSAAKHRDRQLLVYDCFGTIPPPSGTDGKAVAKRFATIERGKAVGPGGGTYYGYRDNLKDVVVENFKAFGIVPEVENVTFVEGLFETTMCLDEPVALAHIDCDWYESVRTCLSRIAPQVQPQGRMVIDDYWHWRGCRTAVDEFLGSHPQFQPSKSRSGRLHLVRQPS